ESSIRTFWHLLPGRVVLVSCFSPVPSVLMTKTSVEPSEFPDVRLPFDRNAILLPPRAMTGAVDDPLLDVSCFSPVPSAWIQQISDEPSAFVPRGFPVDEKAIVVLSAAIEG